MKVSIQKNQLFLAVGVVALLGLISVMHSSYQGLEEQRAAQEARLELLNTNLREHKQLALHIHPVIQIEVLGEPYSIPANTGISQQGVMRVIHTHDASGKLHVEAPVPYQFELRDFFAIWGKTLSDECLFEYCEDAEHELVAFVNGSIVKENIPNIELNDEDVIRLVYRKL